MVAARLKGRREARAFFFSIAAGTCVGRVRKSADNARHSVIIRVLAAGDTSSDRTLSHVKIKVNQA
jgi:DNA-directed RNA polymerase specialized sigma24 family protein